MQLKTNLLTTTDPIVSSPALGFGPLRLRSQLGDGQIIL